jgi:hypothetical protein
MIISRTTIKLPPLALDEMREAIGAVLEIAKEK